jgi:hypothetical protein
VDLPYPLGIESGEQMLRHLVEWLGAAIAQTVQVLCQIAADSSGGSQPDNQYSSLIRRVYRGVDPQPVQFSGKGVPLLRTPLFGSHDFEPM